MKKVLAIAVLLLVFCSMSMAQQPDWALQLCAGSQAFAGMNEGVYGMIGVMADATDGVDSAYEEGMTTDFLGDETVVWAQSNLGGTCNNFDFQSPALPSAYPGSQKVFPFSVAALASAPVTGIGLYFSTVEALIPPAPSADIQYFLRLVDNKGMVVEKPAWAGGGVWAPGTMIPMVIPSSAPTAFGQVLLPLLKLPAGANAGTLMASGYQFEFVEQGVVPEPSSLMVLGTGLAGLVGLVSRRRRV